MRKLLNDFKDLDSSIVKVRNMGFKFSFVLILCFTYILYFYAINPVSRLAFDIGYLGIKGSLMLFASFYVGALASDKIKKGLIH